MNKQKMQRAILLYARDTKCQRQWTYASETNDYMLNGNELYNKRDVTTIDKLL